MHLLGTQRHSPEPVAKLASSTASLSCSDGIVVAAPVRRFANSYKKSDVIDHRDKTDLASVKDYLDRNGWACRLGVCGRMNRFNHVAYILRKAIVTASKRHFFVAVSLRIDIGLSHGASLTVLNAFTDSSCQTSTCSSEAIAKCRLKQIQNQSLLLPDC